MKNNKNLSIGTKKEIKKFEKLEKQQLSIMVAKIKRMKIIFQYFDSVEKINAGRLPWKKISFSLESASEFMALNNYFKYRIENINELIGNRFSFDVEDFLDMSKNFCDSELFKVDTKNAKKILNAYYKKFLLFSSKMSYEYNHNIRISQYQVDELSQASFVMDILISKYETEVRGEKIKREVFLNPGLSFAEIRKAAAKDYFDKDSISEWVKATFKERLTMIDNFQKNVDKEFIESLSNFNDLE